MASNPKLEYLAKRGVLGLDAFDAAHTAPDTLAQMFPQAAMPEGQLVAENEPMMSGISDYFRGQSAPKTKKTEETTTTSKPVRSKQEADLNYRLLTTSDSQLSQQDLELKQRLLNQK